MRSQHSGFANPWINAYASNYALHSQGFIEAISCGGEEVDEMSFDGSPIAIPDSQLGS